VEQTLICDLKTEVDFRLPCETDFDTIVVNFFATRGGLMMKKLKALSGKPKRMENQRKRIVCRRSGLKIATKVSLCHRSGLGCDC
jgi:hypothetical protein